MKIFDFDSADYRSAYAENHWVHIRNGVAPEFHAALRDFVQEESLRAHLVEGAGLGIGGQKEQALFEFPDTVDYPNELYDVVSAVCGLNRGTMTLSERHIKAYEPDADPEPAAHKDRLASQVSMGLSIDIPAESKLVLYPLDYRDVNPFNVSWALRRSLEPDQLPEVALKSAREVELDDSGGDVVMFAGSSMWHLRRNSARAVNLYLKFNDFGCDPLGEDPATPTIRERTLEALNGGEGAFAGLVPVLGRRLDVVARQYNRNGWQEVIQLNVWGEEPIGLAEWQLDVLHAVDGRRNVQALADELARDGITKEQIYSTVRRLASHGAVELTDSKTVA